MIESKTGRSEQIDRIAAVADPAMISARAMAKANAVESSLKNVSEKVRQNESNFKEMRRTFEGGLENFALSAKVYQLEYQLHKLEIAFEVSVELLDSDEFELKQPFKVTVAADGHGGYVSTCFNTGISMSGDSRSEAVESLKMHMVFLYSRLCDQPDTRLGPIPRRQKRVLARLIGKKA